MRMPLFGPSARLIVPEGVEAAGIGGRAQGVGEAERQKLAEFFPRFRQEQRVRGPLFGMGRVARLGDHVEVAGEDERLFVVHELLRMAMSRSMKASL